VGDKIDLKKSRHHKHSSKHKNKDTGKEQKNTKTIKNKTMTSPEEPSTQLQKHNYKKRVIEKASHCLCHLASIGRKGDQLCTAKCLTLKLYQNKTQLGG
jgi:hypothetical protein